MNETHGRAREWTTDAEQLFVAFCRERWHAQPEPENGIFNAREAREVFAAGQASVATLSRSTAAMLVERWYREWLAAEGGHWGDKINWATARQIAVSIDDAQKPKWDGRSSTLENELALGREEYARRNAPGQMSADDQARQEEPVSATDDPLDTAAILRQTDLTGHQAVHLLASCGLQGVANQFIDSKKGQADG